MENCEQKKLRDESVTIAKGLAIILMVMAHARCPQIIQMFINMFHMPLFFFFSGYCFKEYYLDDWRSFFVKRVTGVYVPYVKWGLLFLVLHNVFFYLNLYNGEYGFRGNVSHLYSVREVLINTLYVSTRLTDAEQLLGGYWFLHTLFFSSFIFYIVIKIFKKPDFLGGGVSSHCLLDFIQI